MRVDGWLRVNGLGLLLSSMMGTASLGCGGDCAGEACGEPGGAEPQADCVHEACGELGWGERAPISETVNGDIFGKLAMNSEGRAVFIWLEGGGTQAVLLARRYDFAAGWGDVQTITSTADSSDGVSAVVDDAGNALVVWSGSNGVEDSVWVSRQPLDGTWSVPETLDAGGALTSPRVDLSSQGRVFATWRDASASAIHSRTYDPAVGWSDRATPSVGTEVGGDAELSVLPDGTALMTWTGEAIYSVAGFGSPTGYPIWVNRFEPESGWGTAGPIDDFGSESIEAHAPRVHLDEDGTLCAAWVANMHPYRAVTFNRYLPEAGWSNALVHVGSDAPEMSVDASGNALLLWVEAASTAESDTTIGSHLSDRSTGSLTAMPVDDPNLTGLADVPALAGNSDGEAIAIWRRHNSEAVQTWANRYEPGVGWGTRMRIAETAAPAEPVYGYALLDAAIDGRGNALLVWTEKHQTNVSVQAMTLTR